MGSLPRSARNGHCLAGLSVAILVGLLVIGRPGEADPANHSATIARLRGALARRPVDVDLRLRLAHLLAWDGRLAQARREAERVIERAPRYWDAHLLLARLDAWQERRVEAAARVRLVLRAQPQNANALELAARIAEWSGHLTEARRLLVRQLQRAPSADLLVRLGRVEARRLHFLAAHRLAGQALELDPGNSDALELRRSIQLVVVDLTYELESFPVQDDRIGHGEQLTATLLPGAFLNVSLIHELRLRFGTLNNRLLLRGEWRPTSRLRIGLLGGGAFPASVVPQLTTAAQVHGALGKHFDLTVGYGYDRLPWAGDLHGLRVYFGSRLPAGVRVEVGYLLGFFLRCGSVDALQGMQLRGELERGRLQAYLQYGFGSETDRPLAKPQEVEVYDAAGCSEEPGRVPLPLPELRSHNLGVGAVVHVTQRLSLRAGYTIQLRFQGGEAHLAHFGLRLRL